MSSKFYSKLCMGTFFTLLLQSRKDRYSSLDNLEGKKDHLADYLILLDLIRVVRPSHNTANESTMKSCTSNLKCCKPKSSKWIPFNSKQFIDDFDQNIHNDYSSILIRMHSLITRYFHINNAQDKNIIGNRIFELISLDKSITDNAVFYLSPNEEITKKQLLEKKHISLQPFLLSVYYYIIKNQIDNKEGKDTFDSWHEKDNVNSVGRFTSVIGLKTKASFKMIDESNDLFKPMIASTQNLEESSIDYSSYLENLKNKYYKVKTFLYNNESHELRDFFVCNDITFSLTGKYKKGVFNFSNEHYTIQNATTNEIVEMCGNFIIISGTGGIGKTMMMKHFLLNSIETFNEKNIVPFFVSIKNYNDTYEDLLKFAYSTVENLSEITFSDFSSTVESGKALFLFDGLDELNSKYHSIFDIQLEKLTDKHSNNIFILSSRPYTSFIEKTRFRIITLDPFRKEQAIELIEKLNFRPDEPNIKNTFKEKLESELFETHRAFAENPLLLTIMLMTFENFAEVPSRLHIFYREAFLALSQKHDANKGLYNRLFLTKLSNDRFSDYLAEFCANSYYNEKYEFTYFEIKEYFDSLTELNNERYPDEHPTCSDFIYDLTTNLCLLYLENSQYHFTHRSFQEYFCALYLSKIKDNELLMIGDFFENKNQLINDKTFDMLYDMIPKKIEEFIYIPFLEKKYKECDDEDGYWTFLKIFYPEILYPIGTTVDTVYTISASFLYNSIKVSINIPINIKFNELPYYEEFVTDEFLLIENEGEYSFLIDINEYSKDFLDGNVVDPDGWVLSINIESFLEDKSSYLDIVEFLESEECKLFSEYKLMRQYLKKLKSKYQNRNIVFFDKFKKSI
jgi:hypothetical protein